MKSHFTAASTLVLALIFSASASAADKAPAAAPAAPAAMTTEKGGMVSAKGDAAVSMTLSTVTAKVTAIDQATRMVTLTGPKGNSRTFKASDEVRNLAQVKVGDKVLVEYYEGVVAELDTSSSPAQGVTVTEGAARAPLGQHPAGAMTQVVSKTVQVVAVNSKRNTIRFHDVGASADTARTLEVQKPEFQKMLKTLKAGDKVTVSYFEALAVSVKPAAK